MTPERMSFDEACRELGVTEAELEQLVAAGEIASIKEGDTLYFKKEVVRKFKKTRESEPTILLADEEINLLETDELDLLADEGTTPQKVAAKAGDRIDLSLDDEGLPEIDLGKDESRTEIRKKVTEEVVVKKDKKAIEDTGDETLLNLDGLLEDDSEATTPVPESVDDSTLLDTDLLDLGGGDADPFGSDTVEETAVDLTEPGTLLRGGGARVMQMKRKESHAPWTIALALAALVLLLPLGVLTNLMFAHSPEATEGVPPDSRSSWIQNWNVLEGPVQMVADMFKSK
jgi:excisionase family DNA binding protein